MRRTVLLLLLFVSATGCSRESKQPAPAPPEFVDAPASGKVATIVRAELEKSWKERRDLLVYVSASWCEPCERFQKAVENGKLNSELANMRFLKFDADRDEQRLAADGYQYRLIPLFVVPTTDGTAGANRMEGSIKGERAVDDNLLPRLRELTRR